MIALTSFSKYRFSLTLSLGGIHQKLLPVIRILWRIRILTVQSSKENKILKIHSWVFTSWNMNSISSHLLGSVSTQATLINHCTGNVNVFLLTGQKDPYLIYELNTFFFQIFYFQDIFPMNSMHPYSQIRRKQKSARGFSHFTSFIV